MKISKKYYPLVFIAVVVMLLITLLVITNNVTAGRIETLNDAETVEALQGIFTEADSYTLTDEIYTVYDGDLNVLGYAFYVKGIGYSAWFNVLVGLEDETTIAGIEVISHGEHQGTGYSQGPSVDFSTWSLQFVGLEIEDCVLSKDGGTVDAVTMATIGSRAITNAIHDAAVENAEIIASW